MMQLRILLHIFLLLFFVGIVFGKHASLSEEILERKSRATSEHTFHLEVMTFFANFIKVVNIICNCKELEEVFSMENSPLCKLTHYFKVNEYLDTKNLEEKSSYESYKHKF